jgi:hypothetical protein
MDPGTRFTLMVVFTMLFIFGVNWFFNQFK